MTATAFSKHLAHTQSELGTRMILARLRSGLDQSAVARAAGIGRKALSRYEAGDRVPRFDVLCAVCRACGTTVSELTKDMP